MFHSLTTHPELTQAQHRALPHVSNSDLSNLKNERLGIKRQPNPIALTFGTHFHTATLEPGQYQRTDERCDWPLVEQLAAAVRRRRYCRDILYRGTAELTHTATHAATGLTVKIRPDLLLYSKANPAQARTLFDFKTSSCMSYAQFCGTIEQYDYDRQAALYADMLGATRFVIIGVQKKAPHEVWQVELMDWPGLMEQGRKKYGKLLRCAAEQNAVAA